MPASVVLAHPLLESAALPVPPVAVATVAMLLVAGATRLPRGAPPVPVDRFRDGVGPLRRGWVVGRGLVIAFLLGVAAAGRLGADRATENIAPIAAVALGWPALLLLALLLPGIWAWIDPWDTVARPVAGDDEVGVTEPVDVRPAVAVAVAWTWYLGAYGATFSPRAVGAALIGYAVTVALVAAVAGRGWVARAEAFGLLASWAALVRTRQLSGWRPPRGAELVCGALSGGLVFGALRLSGVWFLLPGPVATSAALLAACLAGAGLLRTAERLSAARGAPGVAAVAALPVALAIALATALTNDRLWIALQLLPSVLDDPLGRGWQLLGGIEPAAGTFPLGAGGRVVIQVALLTAGGMAGAAAATSRSRTAAGPAVFAVAALVGVGTLAVSAL